MFRIFFANSHKESCLPNPKDLTSIAEILLPSEIKKSIS